MEAFSLERIQKKAAIFDLTKLEWMNGQYMSRTAPDELLTLIAGELLDRYRFDTEATDREKLLRCISVTAERARTTLDLAFRVALRYDATLVETTDKARRFVDKDPAGYQRALSAAREVLAGLPEGAWQPEPIEQALRDLASRLEIGVGKIFQPIRIALTGDTVSEPANVLLEVVGRDETLRRLDTALAS